MSDHHHHGPGCHHEPHSHDENCAHDHDHDKPVHAFNRGDLLRNYQLLEKIAAFMPPELLEHPQMMQLDALVGAFEHQFLHTFADDHCHHDHGDIEHEHGENCGHSHSEHDSEDAHHHEHYHPDIDPYEEALKEDQAYAAYRARVQASYTPLYPDLYKFETYV